MYLLNVFRVSRSAAFVLAYLIYLVLFMGFVQRFILVPLAWAFPVLTDRLLAPWSRLQARAPLAMLRVIAGVRMTVEGAIGPENRIVIMNHQSLIDIIIGIALVPVYLTLIPTRRRYAWGIPGISVYLRLARFPLVTQTRKGIRTDLEMIADGAERTRRGETSMLIFPEGHRTTDGSILPFMTRGLRVVLSRAPLPVYCIVGDGMWHLRTLADTMVRAAGAHIHVRVIGPFQPPPAESDIPAFLEFLRDRMIETLEDIRRANPLLRGGRLT
ncbi:MAG TPA: lysophospholipid acyltransferase family protein [Vicinamibacterales bacterium]|nr:lysophospholipid acyltransferase family protein [Vicinamibacterales bacterium]